MRVLFITNIPSPYQLDFFTALAAQPGLKIHVIFAAASESDRQFTVPAGMPFSAQIMPSHTWSVLAKDAHYVKGLSKHLEPFSGVDLAVISGSYFMPAAVQLRWWADRRGIPWLYWGEDPHKKADAGARRLKDAYLRWFLRSAVGALGVGQRACESYREVMGGRKLVFNLPYAPDLRPITQPSERLLAMARESRAEWKLESAEVMLFSGSLSERKAPDMLLGAFASLAGSHPRLCLMFAGDGPMRASLQEQVNRQGLQHRTRFLGFVEGDALRAAYLSADLFVLPTRTHEGWGVVVQEALAAGLAVLASDRVGSGHDLIDARTGRVFVAGDQSSLERELEALLGDDERASFSRRTERVGRAEASGSQAAARRTADVLRSVARGEAAGVQFDQ